ncbi:MAG: hypothetical protein ACRCVN_05730 [Spirochaetia bacterium]
MKKITQMLWLLLLTGLFGCTFNNDPRTVAQSYFDLLYSFRFESIKPLARAAGLMEAAYFEGRISEMSDEEKLAFLDPAITINTIEMISAKHALVKVSVRFASGTLNTFNLDIQKYGYRWCVSAIEPPLANGVIYVY